MFALLCIVVLAIVTIYLFLSGQVVLGVIAGALCLVVLFTALGLMDKVFTSY